MTKISALLACLCAALALTTTATAGVTFGVTDDTGKFSSDRFYSSLNELGLAQNTITIGWDAPSGIHDQAYVDAAVAAANAHGVRMVFQVSGPRARSFSDDPNLAGQFTAWLQQLARRYPTVKHFIVGNEPNQPRFWQPQFVGGKGASAAGYEALLAQAYDALKAVDTGIVVIGVGLSPRGNDNPSAPNNVSTSPVRFIRDLGAAYRASGRTKPIMDMLSFHPYPAQNSDPLARGYQWPNAGIPNLDRIKQAIWDAFNGTAQPTFGEGGSSAGLRFVLDEVGWQVSILASMTGLYSGTENVKLIDEATQAKIYGELVGLVACDSSVYSLNFFHLLDESDLDRFQSGLFRTDWSARPSADAVKTAIAAAGGGCTGRPVAWRHTTSVAGASVRFGPGGPTIGAEEEATFKAGLFRVTGPSLPSTGQAAMARSLAASSGPALVSSAPGTVKAYWSSQARLSKRGLKPGWYAYGVRLNATMNPARTSFFAGKPFRVGRG